MKTKNKLMIGLVAGLVTLTGLYSAEGMNEVKAVTSDSEWSSITCEVVGEHDGEYIQCENSFDVEDTIWIDKEQWIKGDVLNVLFNNDDAVKIDKLGVVEDGLFIGLNADESEAIEPVTDDTTGSRLDIFYMYSNETGAYFLDPLAAVENVVFVPFVALEEWSININKLHHGMKFVGVFDSKYEWELLGLEYVK